MKPSYFKPRKSFSFSAHQFDLGTFMGLWHSHDDNHFLLKLYRMDEKEFTSYYTHHLNYSLENNLASQENFFRHVWQIVKIRIKHLEIQDPFSRNHAMHRQNLAKLQRFQKYLTSIDEWNARPANIVITEKDEHIQNQKQEIEKVNLSGRSGTMKKLAILLIFFAAISTKLYSQNDKSVSFLDTVKFSGAIIYDQKKKVVKVIKNVTRANFEGLKSYKKSFKNTDYVLLETIEVKSILRKQTGTGIAFCDNDNSEKFQFQSKELLYDRYKIIFLQMLSLFIC